MSAFYENVLSVRLAGRRVGTGALGKSKPWKEPNTMRSLTPQVVWFDGAIQEYMSPKIARAMGDTGALLMTIARRSTRKHRRKKLAELTPYERDYYAGGAVTVDKRGRVKRARNARGQFAAGFDKSKFPVMPADPGSPARFTPGSATSLDYRNTILFGYDPVTRAVVAGRVKLAGSGAQRRLIPQLSEEGGMAPVSYGPHYGRMAYIAARPTMRLAMAVALPRIERLFKDDGKVDARTAGREAQVTIH